jgi:hypothetical protein
MALLEHTASARAIGHRSVLPFALALGPSAFVLGCGGDSTGPDVPNVSGRYQRSDAFAATTCTPQRPPPGGTVILDAFSLSTTVRIEQTGSRLTMTYPDFPAAAPDTGSVDRDGKVTFGFTVNFQEDPREGNRLFFVDLTASHALQRLDNGARLAGSGSYVNVFHEGSATAPVFATCSRTVTTTLARRTG